MAQNSLKKILSEIFIFEFNFKSLKLQFFESFALMFSSGIPISQILDIQIEETQSKKLKRTIKQIKFEIDAGSSIHQSFRKHKIVPRYLLNLLKVGEESGNLNSYIKVGLDNIQKDREFRSQIRSASLYPSFVLIVLFAVSILIFTFVIPSLSTIYDSFDVELPLPTRIIISIGNFMQTYGAIVIPVFLLISTILVYFLFIFKKTKYIGQSIISKIPILGQLIKKTEIARFSYLMGTLLETGFPVTDSLKMVIGSTSLVRYQKYYKRLYIEIEAGFSFKDIFLGIKESKKLVDAYPRQLIISGEESANLAGSFLKIAKTYQKLTASASKNFGVLFEPVLLTIVWVGVAGIALAIISPIYSLVGNFNEVSSTTPNQVEELEGDNSIVTLSQEELANNSQLSKVKTIATGEREIPIYSEPNGEKITTAKSEWIYELKDIQEGWYQIVLEDGSIGWLESLYVQEI